MLPHISAEDNSSIVGRKVYINPNFHNQIATGARQPQPQGRLNGHDGSQNWERPAIHINPNFLRQQEYQLLVLQQQRQQQLQLQQQQQQHIEFYETTVAANVAPCPPAKIISKASTCLVRKPPQVKSVTRSLSKSTPTVTQPPLVSLSKRKLIRQGASIPTRTSVPSSAAPAVPPAKRTKYKLVRAISLTNSSSTPLVKKRRSLDFVARYALRRTNDASSPKKTQILKPSVNKSLSMVSIHGVMYKKTAKNKLTKLDARATTPSTSTAPLQPKTSNTTGRTLFVCGTKFVLDPSGCRLTRVPVNSPQLSLNKSLRTRIDIGGLTYVSSPKTQNVFIRTTNHVSRAHLMTAKQRSLQLLNRSLVKTNVPCAIYQRLGKCAAHNRGKCRRLHDKRQVAICPSFLRGECTKEGCLLSHNVTLEKMPVCRYFLRGICVREDCPYLHKKLSQKAEICIDFLRGYCARAADCNMRHEFVCPELARSGKCSMTNCSYCKQMKQQKYMTSKTTKPKPKLKAKTSVVRKEPAPKIVEEAPSRSRYFKCDSDKIESLPADDKDEAQVEDAIDDVELEEDETPAAPRKRIQLGTLPSFIPLGDSEDH